MNYLCVQKIQHVPRIYTPSAGVKSWLRSLHSSRERRSGNGNGSVGQVVENGKTRLGKLDMYLGPIVISGISGRFPSCDDMDQFRDCLLNGVEMTTDKKRWLTENHPKRFGFVDAIDKFDASFFGFAPRQVNQMDPQSRMLLEVTFEAMVDAGINPNQLRGTRTGVFVGAMGGEAVDFNVLRTNRDNAGYIGLSLANFMLPGRLSYAFHLQGPSLMASTACSSSFSALEIAVNSMRLGACEAAVVTGSCIHLNPQTHLDLLAVNVLAPDGRCKTFDETADGFARSEAVAAILIQRKDNAKRNYATILNIRSNSDGYKHEGLMCPSGRVQEMLFRETYEQAGVDPGHVSYIDAHGTGTVLGDPQELQSISNVFCKTESRKKPLQVGSVKTNMGHSESAAGLCSVAKTIVAIQTGVIPRSLHFNKPKPEQEKLFDGTLEIVTETTPFDRGLIGVSSFGIGGTNTHLIMEPGDVPQVTKTIEDLPIIIPFSGRTKEKLEESIKKATENARNSDYLKLIQSVYQENIVGNSYRGYGTLKPGESESIIHTEANSSNSRPIWVVFPGMGSQYNEMGKDLMRVDPFAESIQRSRATLKNIGVNLDELLKPDNKAIFDDIHLAVLSITAVQIALYDTLKAVGLSPEGIIGHSTGEFLCAYADECFTAEETLLVTDARGRAFKESHKVIGGMASVGLSWEEVKERCPPDVELACNNAANNVTVSGPLESVSKFAEELKGQGIFAAVVNSCNIAAHSVHVQDAGDLLMKYLKDIIPDKRVRSQRWISTSIAEKDWSLPLAECASPEYFENNLKAPVLFYEALQHVPSRALVIENSPKGFFQALLKETVPKDCVHVAPMMVKAEDKLFHFYDSFGKIFNAGVDVKLDQLYPAVSLPVAANTPCISPLVQWDHETNFKTHIIPYPFDTGAETVLDLQDPRYAFIAGHKIENRVLLPATGYLVLAWSHLADIYGLEFEECPVVFQNVILKRATMVSEKRPVTLISSVLHRSGEFEFTEDGEVIAQGKIQRLPEGASSKFLSEVRPEDKVESEFLPLNQDDIYKEFRLRGYSYSGVFQGIKSIDNQGRWAEVAWQGNWVSFLDTILQTSILRTTSRNLALPVDFEKITIDPLEFLKHVEAETREGEEHPTTTVIVSQEMNKVYCPGIELKGLQATVVPRKGQRGNLAYEKYTFSPLHESSVTDFPGTLSALVDLVLENNRAKELKVVDVFTNHQNSMAELFQTILRLKPLRESDVRMITLASEAELMDDRVKQLGTLTTKETVEQLVPEVSGDLVFLDEISLLSGVANSLKNQGFILASINSETEVLPPEGTTLIAKKDMDGKSLMLFRKINADAKTVAHIAVNSDTFEWLTPLQATLAEPGKENARIYVTCEENPTSGVLGLVNCLRQEEGGERIRCIFSPDKKLNLNFNKPDSNLKAVLEKDLVMNIVKDGQVGTYRHLPLEAETNGVTKEVEYAYVSTTTPGDLSTLRWIESPLKYYERNLAGKPNPKEKLYQIAYAAMNFRDVLLATGTIPIDPRSSYKDSYMGFEFSGYDEKGKRVMGMIPTKALATSVVCPTRFVWEVPEHWSLEEAATIPVVYATVFYAFFTRGRVKPGQSVLIHAGTGGVGQAAISVALHHGMEVFTTVGTDEKRKLIKEMFPQLQDDHIGNSRDTTFEEQFMHVTKGKGVDVVLNSLADDKLMASVRCLAVNGKFLEIGVYDAFKNTPLGMRAFLKNIEFHGIELYHIFDENNADEAELRELMNKGIHSGAVRPLPRHVFDKEQLEDAFRFMASGKHMGKLVLKVRDEAKPSEKLSLPAMGRCYFPKDKTYIIVGGLGGLGMEVANWLVERGARNLILTSRSGLTTGYQSLCLRKWSEMGVKVETPAVDLSDFETAEKFMKETTKSHSVGGIFNSALVLRDETIENLTVEDFHEVCHPKAAVTKHLDTLSRSHCPGMDYFVVFSSVACGRGNAAQTNYGYANSVMERICENRKADGLHGLAIQWGVLGEVGVVAEKLFKNMDGTEVFGGTLPQNVDSCLEVLDAALQQDNPVCSSIVVAEKGKRKGDKSGLLQRMIKIFGIKDPESLSNDKKLVELGMDSLIGVELKQTLEREYDMPVTKELLLSLTIGDLKAIDDGTFSAEDMANRSAGGEGILPGDIIPFHLHEDCLVKLRTSDSGRGQCALFIVHGIEGSADIFLPLAEALNNDVYGFQYGAHTENVTVQELATQYITELKDVQPEGPYKIAGYSAGASIAYEMVMQLEQAGDTVTDLIFLDGCPTWEHPDNPDIPKMMTVSLAESKQLFDKLGDAEREKFKEAVTGDYTENTQLFIQALNAAGIHDYSKMEQNVNLYLQFTNAVAIYRPERKYNGNVTLVKAKKKSTMSELIVDEHYNVKKHCTGNLAEFEVEGDHEGFLSGSLVDETAEILNKLL